MKRSSLIEKAAAAVPSTIQLSYGNKLLVHSGSGNRRRYVCVKTRQSELNYRESTRSSRFGRMAHAIICDDRLGVILRALMMYVFLSTIGVFFNEGPQARVITFHFIRRGCQSGGSISRWWTNESN